MFKSLLELFKPDPIKKYGKIKDRKYKEAVNLQRNGNLREYANVMKEIELLEDEILRLSRKRNETQK